MSVDPSNLTVDRLKRELDRLSIPYPKSARKDALVDIYRTHFGEKDSFTRKVDFGDDSLASPVSEPVLRSKQGVNVSQLTDTELITMLEERGADVGPVTDTTRIVYKKKLLKLLDSERPGVSYQRTVQRQVITHNRRDNVHQARTDEDDEDENEDEDGSRHEDKSDSASQDDMRSHWKESSRMDEFRQRQFARSDSPRGGGVSSYSPRQGESSWTTTYREQRVGVTSSAHYATQGDTLSGGDDLLTRGSGVSRGDYISRGDSLSRPPIGPSSSGSNDKTDSSCCPVWLQFLVLVLFSLSLFLVLQGLDDGWPHPVKYIGALWSSTDNRKIQ